MAGRSAPFKRRSRNGRPGALGWLIRVTISLVLLWLGGLFLFVWFQTPPAIPGVATDGVAVLTGGAKRLERGTAVLRAGLAKRLLISGVNPQVTPEEMRLALQMPEELFDCCVDLGFVAATTRDNADEVSEWVERYDWRSIRIVTAGYHMPRARQELAAKLPPDLIIVEDGVPAYLPSLAMVREYLKFLGSRLTLLVRVQP